MKYATIFFLICLVHSVSASEKTRYIAYAYYPTFHSIWSGANISVDMDNMKMLVNDIYDRLSFCDIKYAEHCIKSISNGYVFIDPTYILDRSSTVIDEVRLSIQGPRKLNFINTIMDVYIVSGVFENSMHKNNIDYLYLYSKDNGIIAIAFPVSMNDYTIMIYYWLASNKGLLKNIAVTD